MSLPSLCRDVSYPHASLERATPLFIEMLRQIQEEGSEGSFFNSEIGDLQLGFSFLAKEHGVVLGSIAGAEVVDLSYLSESQLQLLSQREWSLPGEDGIDDEIPRREWAGVTSRADRRHIAKEMLSVATEVLGFFPEDKIRFQLNLHGPDRYTQA